MLRKEKKRLTENLNLDPSFLLASLNSKLTTHLQRTLIQPQRSPTRASYLPVDCYQGLLPKKEKPQALWAGWVPGGASITHHF